MLFPKKCIIWTKKIKLWNEQHSVEYKTDINTEYFRNAVNFLVAQIHKMDLFPPIAFACMNIGHLKFKLSMVRCVEPFVLCYQSELFSD